MLVCIVIDFKKDGVRIYTPRFVLVTDDIEQRTHNAKYYRNIW